MSKAGGAELPSYLKVIKQPGARHGRFFFFFFFVGGGGGAMQGLS